MIRGLANQVINHRTENGGKIQCGFVQRLIDSANDVNSWLEFLQNDIRNEANQIIAATTAGKFSTASLTESSNDAEGELISML